MEEKKQRKNIAEQVQEKLVTRRHFVGALGMVAGAIALPTMFPSVITAFADETNHFPSENEINKPKPSVGIDWYNVRDYKVKGNGKDDDEPALKTLLQRIGEKNATVYFPSGNYKIGKDMVFPKNIYLLFDHGAILEPIEGVTIEIQSFVGAKLSRLFAGKGKVIGNFNGLPVYPQWWGAVGDKIHDDTEAFQQVFRLSKETQNSITIHVPKGDYVWSDALEIYGNTSVICEKGATFWRNHTRTMLYNYEYNGTPSPGYSGNGNILFENARFEFVGYDPSFLCYEDGNVLQFAHASDWTFRNCEFYDLIDGHAIEINSSQNVVIEHCKFYGYRELATNRWYVEAIQIDHAGQEGIQGALPYDNTHCKNITIQNCYFGKGRTYTFTKNGVKTTVEFKAWPAGIGGHTHKEERFHQNITICNNTFEGMRYYAIRPYKWLNTTITENVFYECGGGIYAVSGANHVNFGKAGPLRRLHITNNQFINGQDIWPDHFQGNRRFAIGIYSTDVVSEDVVIKGNMISVFKDSGIIVRNVRRVSISNNHINYMDKHAIEINDCSHLTIENNQIYKPKEYGIFLNNCTQVLIKGNQISESEKQGILLENNESTHILGNIVSNPNDTALELRAVETCIVNSNIVSQASKETDGLVFSQGTNNGIVRDNLFNGNVHYGLLFDSSTKDLRYGYHIGTIQNNSQHVNALVD